MGDLIYIANHTKKIKLADGKFREMLFANWGDILMHLLYNPHSYQNRSEHNWYGDNIEIVSSGDDKHYSKYYDYEDKTKEYYELFKDAIGENI